MNTVTNWLDYWNRKVRKLTIVDLKLIQVASMAVILIVVVGDQTAAVTISIVPNQLV